MLLMRAYGTEAFATPATDPRQNAFCGAIALRHESGSLIVLARLLLKPGAHGGHFLSRGVHQPRVVEQFAHRDAQRAQKTSASRPRDEAPGAQGARVSLSMFHMHDSPFTRLEGLPREKALCLLRPAP